MTKEAISTERALKLALAALKAYRPVIVKRYGLPYSVGDSAIIALREALASEAIEQPAQQEPVAWRSFGKLSSGLECWRFATHRSTFHDDPEQEPLYTSPPAQRKPLTDEQIAEACGWKAEMGCKPLPRELRIARAIEAAHGIYAPTELKENT